MMSSWNSIENNLWQRNKYSMFCFIFCDHAMTLEFNPSKNKNKHTKKQLSKSVIVINGDYYYGKCGALTVSDKELI